MQTHCSGKSLLVAVLGIGAVSGCSILAPEEACTLVGCTSGLSVRLTSLPTEPYRVELLVPGARRPFHFYECDGGSSCLQAIHSPLLALSHISVTVTTAAGSRVTDVPNVEYERYYPNGPDCPPPCLNATITAEVPV